MHSRLGTEWTVFEFLACACMLSLFHRRSLFFYMCCYCCYCIQNVIEFMNIQKNLYIFHNFFFARSLLYVVARRIFNSPSWLFLRMKCTVCTYHVSSWCSCPMRCACAFFPLHLSVAKLLLKCCAYHFVSFFCTLIFCLQFRLVFYLCGKGLSLLFWLFFLGLLTIFANFVFTLICMQHVHQTPWTSLRFHCQFNYCRRQKSVHAWEKSQ